MLRDRLLQSEALDRASAGEPNQPRKGSQVAKKKILQGRRKEKEMLFCVVFEDAQDNLSQIRGEGVPPARGADKRGAGASR